MTFKFSLKKLFYLTIIIFCLLFLTNNYRYSRHQPEIILLDIPFTEPVEQIKTINTQKITDLECANNTLWVKIDKYVFLKRSSFYYLIDYKLIRFYYVMNTYATFDMTVDVKAIHKRNRRVLKHLKKLTLFKNAFEYARGLYKVKIVDLDFDLNINDMENVELYVKFYTSSLSTDFLNVNVKYLNITAKPLDPKKLPEVKKSSVVCSKIFYLNNLVDYDNMRWWLDLNLQIGHETISFYENLIDMNYFQEIQSYIEFESFRCFPNFLKNRNSEYLNSLKEITYRNVFSYASTDIFNVQMTNECYMRHGDKVKYVALIDNDETIIPRLDKTYFTIEDFQLFMTNLKFDNFKQIENNLKLVTCDRYDTKGHAMQSYLDELIDIYKYKNVKSLYFQQAFYLKNDMVQEIFDLLEKKVEKMKNVSNDLIVLENKNAKSEYLSFNLTFKLENNIDLEYSKNLVKLYRNFAKPFIKNNKESFGKVSKNYQRFFALISMRDNEFLMGKSIHTTDHTNPLCIHSLCGRRDKLVSFNHGHLSHFRGSFKFKNQVYSIRQIIFDLNYLNCFVKPLLK
ncbi:unnamed protein product [Brachionus calyciflorus]|uniref:Glycosyltransferase family 92 protein n=1 Tax=Brachionus calyciflorus TaxID=104777 RepID=A0A813ZCU6_9BILA|nr:unnamed protein product [Brachionus calyciflorus]